MQKGKKVWRVKGRGWNSKVSLGDFWRKEIRREI
jgi:hypothetical protein